MSGHDQPHLPGGGEPLGLGHARELSGLSVMSLWGAYVAIGGVRSLDEVTRHLDSENVLDDGEHDVVVQALNDRFVELGLDHPVAYRLG